MYCTNCGSRIDSQLNFCPMCGSEVQKELMGFEKDIPEDIILPLGFSRTKMQKSLNRLIDELPKQQRAVFLAYYKRNKSIDEIKNHYNFSEERVKQLLFSSVEHVQNGMNSYIKKRNRGYFFLGISTLFSTILGAGIAKSIPKKSVSSRNTNNDKVIRDTGNDIISKDKSPVSRNNLQDGVDVSKNSPYQDSVQLEGIENLTVMGDHTGLNTDAVTKNEEVHNNVEDNFLNESNDEYGLDNNSSNKVREDQNSVTSNDTKDINVEEDIEEYEGDEGEEDNEIEWDEDGEEEEDDEIDWDEDGDEEEEDDEIDDEEEEDDDTEWDEDGDEEEDDEIEWDEDGDEEEDDEIEWDEDDEEEEDDEIEWDEDGEEEEDDEIDWDEDGEEEEDDDTEWDEDDAEEEDDEIDWDEDGDEEEEDDEIDDEEEEDDDTEWDEDGDEEEDDEIDWDEDGDEEEDDDTEWDEDGDEEEDDDTEWDDDDDEEEDDETDWDEDSDDGEEEDKEYLKNKKKKINKRKLKKAVKKARKLTGKQIRNRVIAGIVAAALAGGAINTVRQNGELIPIEIISEIESDDSIDGTDDAGDTDSDVNKNRKLNAPERFIEKYVESNNERDDYGMLRAYSPMYRLLFHLLILIFDDLEGSFLEEGTYAEILEISSDNYEYISFFADEDDYEDKLIKIPGLTVPILNRADVHCSMLITGNGKEEYVETHFKVQNYWFFGWGMNVGESKKLNEKYGTNYYL